MIDAPGNSQKFDKWILGTQDAQKLENYDTSRRDQFTKNLTLKILQAASKTVTAYAQHWFIGGQY